MKTILLVSLAVLALSSGVASATDMPRECQRTMGFFGKPVEDPPCSAFGYATPNGIAQCEKDQSERRKRCSQYWPKPMPSASSLDPYIADPFGAFSPDGPFSPLGKRVRDLENRVDELEQGR